MNTHYYSSYSPEAPIYTSRTIRRVPVGRNEYLMSYGDRISVRVAVDGKTIMEYETRSVADMTDLTGDLRKRAKGYRGLAVVSIRNHDRGWRRERRIMLYAQRKFTSARPATAVQTPMFFPWEL